MAKDFLTKDKSMPEVYVKGDQERIAHSPADAVQLEYNGWSLKPAEDVAEPTAKPAAPKATTPVPEVKKAQ